MKKTKAKELKSLEKAQLESKLAEAKKELLKLNAKIATKVVPENPGSIKQIKKTIARILTFKKQQKNNKEEKDKKQ